MLFADPASTDHVSTDPSLAEQAFLVPRDATSSRCGRSSLGIFSAMVIAVLTISQTGCMLVPDIKNKPQYHNPFPQISRVAILPFRNQSQEPTLIGSRVSLAYYDELQSIPGFEVLPTGLVETQWSAFETNVLRRSATTPEDFQRFARYLGVDAVLQGAITDYDAYYPPRMTLKVNWYAANPGFHPIPAGYGLPWGTKHEKKIPQWIRLEAERALAREQLKTQTPEDSEEISEEEPSNAPATTTAPQPILPNDPFLNSNGNDRDSNKPNNAVNPSNPDSGNPSPTAPAPPVGTGGADDPNVTNVSGTQFGPVRLKQIHQTLRPLNPREMQSGQGIEDGIPENGIPEVVTPETLVQDRLVQDKLGDERAPALITNLNGDYTGQDTLPNPTPIIKTPPVKTSPQRSLMVPSNVPEEVEPLEVTQMDASQLSNDSELPDDWPDPKGFVPAKPKRNKPQMIAQYEPIISHMKAYNGSNEDFTESLGEYFYFRDDARFGGWQAYLQRSEDFIRFCCHLHVRETLAARGGELESRMILRWPIGRYER